MGPAPSLSPLRHPAAAHALGLTLLTALAAAPGRAQPVPPRPAGVVAPRPPDPDTTVVAAPARSAARPPVPLPAPSSAQPAPPRRAGRWRTGGGLAIGQPTGDFRRNARVGPGVGAHLLATPTRWPALGLRIEGGVQNYGQSVHAVRLEGVPGAIAAPGGQVTTSHDIQWGSVGPQLTVPLGPVQPYAFAAVGISNFATVSTVESDGPARQIVGRTTALSAWAPSQGWGGGLRVRLPRRLGGLTLDAGARRLLHGDVRYLHEGSAVRLQGRRAVVQAVRGRADLVSYHLGVSLPPP